MKVGVAGFGTIGRPVVQALDQGIESLELVAICSRSLDKAEAALSELALKRPLPIVSPAQLAQMCDLVVECVPKESFAEIAQPVLEAGKLLVTVSAAGLLANPDLTDLARAKGARIILATGALLGLDAVRAAREGKIREVRMVTRKPPRSLQGAPYLRENNMEISNLSEPLKVFEGSAAAGAQAFPANVNVAATLGLAGIGPELTRLEIWADPTLDRNTHAIEVDADSARLSMKIENVPSEENPGTGKITALSVIAALRGLVATLKIGT